MVQLSGLSGVKPLVGIYQVCGRSHKLAQVLFTMLNHSIIYQKIEQVGPSILSVKVQDIRHGLKLKYSLNMYTFLFHIYIARLALKCVVLASYPCIYLCIRDLHVSTLCFIIHCLWPSIFHPAAQLLHKILLSRTFAIVYILPWRIFWRRWMLCAVLCIWKRLGGNSHAPCFLLA